MNISSYCYEQRQKEQRSRKLFLGYSLLGSAALHILVAYGLSLVIPATEQTAEDPIEILIVEEPQVEAKQEEEPIVEEKLVEKPQPTPPVEPEPVNETPEQPEAIARPTPPTPPQPQQSAAQEVEPEPPVSEPEQPIAESSPSLPREALREAPAAIAEPETVQPPQPPVANRSQPTRPGNVSGPIAAAEGSSQLREGLTRQNSTAPGNASGSNPGTPNPDAVAARSQPARSAGNSSLPISSAAGCSAAKKPEFPRSLANRGIEARPVVEIVTDASGKAIRSEIATSSGYPELDRAALETADSVTCPTQGGQRRVRLAIAFVQEGSDLEQEALRRQEELERQRQAERERQEELERQQQAEREQQEELERQQQAEEQQPQLEPDPLPPLDTPLNGD